MTAVPARIPADLYTSALPLVIGIGRPSWGQLVAWTCHDHPEQVLEQIAQQTSRAATRAPRGQNRLSTASHTVNARMDAAELEDFNQVLASAEKKQTSTPRAGSAPITRTTVVLAALAVATERAQLTEHTEGTGPARAESGRP